MLPLPRPDDIKPDGARSGVPVAHREHVDPLGLEDPYPPEVISAVKCPVKWIP
jgi:hypothetical protein